MVARFSRTYAVVAVVLALGLGAWTARRVFAQGGTSPFQLWTLRAGMPFDQMEQLAQREMHRRFSCQPLGVHARRCQVETDGPPGVLHVLVDQGGRAVVVRFVVGDTTPKMREEVHRIAAEWTLVSKPSVDTTVIGAVTRWRAGDGAWIADAIEVEEGGIPYAYRLIDGARLAAAAEADPAVLMRALDDGILDDLVADELPARARAVLAHVADSLTARGHRLAATAAALPACAGVPTIAVPAADTLAPDDMTIGAMRAQVIARLFPGARLVTGTESSWLVDTAGTTEEVELTPAVNVSRTRFAMLVNFPSRAAAATESAHGGTTAPTCRAPAMVVSARFGPTGAIEDVRQVDVDPEAIAASVRLFRFVDDADDQLVLRYVGTYATADWIATVPWRAAAGTGKLAILQRNPDGWSLTGADGIERGGSFVPARPIEDMWWWAAPGDSLHVFSADEEESPPRVRRLDLPPDKAGVQSAMVLLTRF